MELLQGPYIFILDGESHTRGRARFGEEKLFIHQQKNRPSQNRMCEFDLFLAVTGNT